MESEKSLKSKAREIYGCKENVLRYIVKSNGSVEYTSKGSISSFFQGKSKKDSDSQQTK